MGCNYFYGVNFIPNRNPNPTRNRLFDYDYDYEHDYDGSLYAAQKIAWRHPSSLSWEVAGTKHKPPRKERNETQTNDGNSQFKPSG
jgi:hypothetical protein